MVPKYLAHEPRRDGRGAREPGRDTPHSMVILHNSVVLCRTMLAYVAVPEIWDGGVPLPKVAGQRSTLKTFLFPRQVTVPN